MTMQLGSLLQTASRRAIVATFGDSRTAQGHQGANGLVGYTENKGFQYWAMAETRNGVSMPASLNFGVSGNTSGMALARLPAAIAAAVLQGASGMTVLLGVNDRLQNIDAATTIANLAECRRLITEAGLLCFLFVDLPCGYALYGGGTYPAVGTATAKATQVRAYQQCRAWVLSQRNQPLTYVVDVSAKFLDPASTTNDLVAGVTSDQVHQNAAGARLMGLGFARVARVLFPPQPIMLPVSNADAWHATEYPQGIFTQNPMVAGTTGSTQSAAKSPASGEMMSPANSTTWNVVYNSAILAAGVSAGATDGITRTYSKVTMRNGLPGQRVALSGVAPGVNPYLGWNLNIPAATLAQIGAGTKVQMVGTWEIEPACQGVLSWEAGVLCPATSGFREVASGNYDAQPLPTLATDYMAGDWESEVLTIPADFTGLTPRVLAYLQQGVTVAATLSFGATGMRIVP